MTRLPKFFVSAPHKVRAGTRGALHDEPYGVRHARQVGSAFTECRMPALSWPIFWDTPFHDELELVCRACVNALVHDRYGHLGAVQDVA
ncbi:MAG TPA: hypothetical protein VLI04_14615 [Nocardioidaceae bacterium]|nr:hypothetical protein [Nocardioidaceae bacterium]